MPQMPTEKKGYCLLFWRSLAAREFSVIRRKPHPLLLWRLKKRKVKVVPTEEKMQCNKFHKIDSNHTLSFFVASTLIFWNTDVHLRHKKPFISTGTQYRDFFCNQRVISYQDISYKRHES